MSADETTRRARRRRQVAAVLVRMYPHAWRDRYGEEPVDLLGAAALTGFVVLDVVRGALDAHRHLPGLVPQQSGRLARVRSAVAATFAAWVMFCFAAAVIGRTTNDPRFDEAARAYRAIGGLRWLAIAGVASSLLGVACAALPLAVASAWQACSRRDGVALALFPAPPAGLAIFVGYTALLAQQPDQPVHSVANAVMTVSWIVVGVTVAEVAGVGAGAQP